MRNIIDLALLDEQGLRDEIEGYVDGIEANIPADAIRGIVINRMRNNMLKPQKGAFAEHLVRNLDGDERMMRLIAARRKTWAMPTAQADPIPQAAPTA